MIINVSSSFTRPANTTQYASGDLVANSATAASVVPLTFTVSRFGAGRGIIRRLRLYKDDPTTTAATFNVHLFTQSPTVTNGDNGVYAVSTVRYFLGTVAVDMSTGATASAADLIKAGTISPEINFDLLTIGVTERRLYGLIAAAGTYTPASGETFEATLELASEY